MRAWPWIAILVAIAVTQVIRAQVLDAVIFGIGAVALGLDASGLTLQRRRPAVPLPVVLVAAAAVAVTVVIAPRHGVVSGVVLGVVGVLAVAFAWLVPPSREVEDEALRRTRVRRAAIGWAAVLLAICLVELWSFLIGRVSPEARESHPAVSELLDPMLDDPIGRAVFVAAWLGVGVLLLTRGRTPRDA